MQGAPLGRPFGQFVQAAGVDMLGVVPSIVKHWRSSGCLQVGTWRCCRQPALCQAARPELQPGSSASWGVHDQDPGGLLPKLRSAAR